MITESREIVIIIKADQTATAQQSTNPKVDGGSTAVKKRKADTTGQTEMLLASVLANQAFSYAKGAVVSQANYQLNRYFDMTDDYNNRQNISNALSLIGMGMSIVGSTYAGFQLGGAVGAVIGFVGSVGNTLLSAHRVVATQEYHIRQSNAQLSYTMSRRGASLTNNSIGENL